MTALTTVLHKTCASQKGRVTLFVVKQKLEERLKEHGSELITTQDFNDIAEEAEVGGDDVAVMRRSLHALGICLWYDKIADLENYVLNPGWISYGVYKIINWLGDKKIHGYEKYELHFDNFSKVFSKEEDVKRYLQDRHRFLFDLLIAYELAYPVRGEENNKLVLPSLLSELQPERGMENAYPIKDSLLMRYVVSGVIPIGTIARFIVRHHKEILVKNGLSMVWRRGVALRDGTGNEALVIEDGLEIRLYVKGKSAITFFDKLRSSLNDIFKSYQSDYPELRYAIAITAHNKVIYVTDDFIFLLCQLAVNNYHLTSYKH